MNIISKNKKTYFIYFTKNTNNNNCTYAYNNSDDNYSYNEMKSYFKYTIFSLILPTLFSLPESSSISLNQGTNKFAINNEGNNHSKL